MPIGSTAVLLKQIIKRDGAKKTIGEIKLKIKKYLINLKQATKEKPKDKEQKGQMKLMVDLNPTTSGITLNVNGLNSKLIGHKSKQNYSLYFYILAPLEVKFLKYHFNRLKKDKKLGIELKKRCTKPVQC